jgi:hypothetical protein
VEYAARHGDVSGCLVSDFKSLDVLEQQVRVAVGARSLRCVLSVDDEDAFVLARRLATELGVPTHPVRLAEATSNKLAMKRIFVEFGIPSSSFVQCGPATSVEDVPLRFPVVLKVPTMNGSECVFPSGSKEELRRQLAGLPAVLDGYAAIDDERLKCREVDGVVLDPRTEWLVEERVDGREYSCDVLFSEGAARVLRVVKKYRGSEFGFFRGFSWVDAQSATGDGLSLDGLQSIVQRIGHAFGFFECEVPIVGMVDFFVVNGGGISVIEIAARPGMSAFVFMMRRVQGWTSVGEWVRACCCLPLRGSLAGPKALSVFIVATKDGVLRTTGCSSLVDFGGRLVDVHEYVQPGTKIETTDGDRWARVVASVVLRLRPDDREEDVLTEVERTFVPIVDDAITALGG